MFGRIKRRALGLAGVLLLFSACAMTPERLPELDRRFYYNLETPEERDAFLKLEDARRQPFLEKTGLWQQWSSLSAEERKAVSTGDIKVGYRLFAAFMAWGPPADRQGRKGETALHTFIRCSSGPRAGRYVRSNLDCDGTSSEIQLVGSGGVIVEIRYPN
jgi:hypothetical protein